MNIDKERKAEASVAELQLKDRELMSRTKELTETLAQQAALLAHKENLLVEVNHRAKNSIALAESILRVQMRNCGEPQVREAFAEALRRLDAIAHVHDMLSKTDSPHQVDLGSYVADVGIPARRERFDSYNHIPAVGPAPGYPTLSLWPQA